jgi:hypothetical protein
MAASGLTGTIVDHKHSVAVVKFAIDLLALMEYINEHSFNNFKLRIGFLLEISKKLFIFSVFRNKHWTSSSGRNWY